MTARCPFCGDATGPFDGDGCCEDLIACVERYLAAVDVAREATNTRREQREVKE